jgi:hypothetical protein
MKAKRERKKGKYEIFAEAACQNIFALFMSSFAC